MLDRPLDPDLDPGTVAAIAAMRHRRHRYQRRFVRIVLSTVVTAVLGIGAISLGGSSDKPVTGPTVPGAATNTPQDQLAPVQQLARDLQDH